MKKTFVMFIMVLMTMVMFGQAQASDSYNLQEQKILKLQAMETERDGLYQQMEKIYNANAENAQVELAELQAQVDKLSFAIVRLKREM